MERLGVLSAHAPPNALVDTYPRTRASQEPMDHRQGCIPGIEGFSTRRSSCLLFQTFSVETHSFLPDEQSDCRDLACQGQTRHRWFHSFGKQSRVELLEGPIDTSSPNGCTLEDIF